MELLKIKDLKTYFYGNKRVVQAVDGVDFSIHKGEVLAIVGESGSGKSVTALSILGLIDTPGKIVSGEIYLEGEDLMKKKEKELRGIRGNRISMIYQNPMSALNPTLSVGYQIEEGLRLHRKMKKNEMKEQVVEIMKAVGIPDAEERYHYYPKQFSGGMRQRLIIAMAIICNPQLLIADEPTTALDVTIQAEILQLLRELKEKLQMSILFITHDLGVVSEMADRVVVMYCGQVVEMAEVRELIHSPMNPYTRGLMDCIPGRIASKEKLHSIRGTVPNADEFPTGCRFCTRCDEAVSICSEKMPPLIHKGKGHYVRCWLYAEEGGGIQ